jgi:hypothetical protein
MANNDKGASVSKKEARSWRARRQRRKERKKLQKTVETLADKYTEEEKIAHALKIEQLKYFNETALNDINWQKPIVAIDVSYVEHLSDKVC